MKKLLLGSIVLTAFSLAIIAFQMSCNKSANAQSSSTGYKPLNLILFQKYYSQGYTVTELWTANTDGTNPQKIPIHLPTNFYAQDGRLTLDGKTVIFETVDSTGPISSTPGPLYSCSLDGSNLKEVVQPSVTGESDNIEGTY